MQTTSHYNFNIVEGSDVVNPLVQENPNWQNLDNYLYVAAGRTVNSANCTKSGNIFVVTLSAPQSGIFRFLAPADFETGDTMTIGGSPVTLKLPDGTAPETGTFVTGVEVFCIQRGTNVTLYTKPNKYVPTASEVAMTSGDSVQDAVDKIGNVIRVFESGDYAAGTPWVLPADAQAVIDAGIPFLVEADFHYGAYVSSKLTKLTTRGFGAHVGLVLDRTDPQVGMVRLSATSFDAYGFDLSHAPVLHNLYIFPLAAY